MLPPSCIERCPDTSAAGYVIKVEQQVGEVDPVTDTVNQITEHVEAGWHYRVPNRRAPQAQDCGDSCSFSYPDRATNSPDTREREFREHTFGAQYFFYKQSRVVLNYQVRQARAPDLDSSAVPKQILDKLDNLFSLQLLVIF